MTIRKFYETEAPVATGGGMSIAEAMAKHGVMNNTDNPVATPIENTEKKEEVKPTETAPAATANPEKVESANSETPSPEVKTEPVIEQKAPLPVPEKPWQEVLKSQQPDSVLKELGFDDKVIKLVHEMKDLPPQVLGFLQAYKDGKHTEYLKEWTTDYKAMPAEEVMRHQLRQEYPTASDAQLEALYKREVVKAYNLDSTDDDEVTEGKLLLDAKADRYRADFIKNQEGKLFPPAPEAKAPQIDPVEVQRAETLKNVTAQFNESAYTKNIMATNVWSIGEGEDKFTFPIDSRAVVDLAINGDESGETLYDKTVDANGGERYTPKVDKQILIATVQKYGMDFITALEKHFRGRGGKAAIEPIENASDQNTNNTSKSEAQPASPAAAMAKGGVINSGGYQR